MKIIKRIIIIVLILPLFVLTSCKRKPNQQRKSAISPTSDLVFCANAVYNSIEEIPNYILSYCCYKEEFRDDVQLKMRFGEPWWWSDPTIYESETIIDRERLIDRKNNNYYLWLIDEEGNKSEFNKEIIKGNSENHKFGFWHIYDKYIMYTWFLTYEIINIPKDYFAESEGEIYLSVFEKNKSTSEEKSLVTVTIKYTNNEGKIKLVAPEKSFSGKGIDEGKTDEEIFKNI